MSRGVEWTEVKKFVVARLGAAQNELLGCPLDKVERVRGRIETLRAVLALEDAVPKDNTSVAAFLNEPAGNGG